MDQRIEKGQAFRGLHTGGQTFVVPNPWDVGTVRVFETLGFKALATTSAGLAFSRGVTDGNAAVTAAATFEHVRAIVEATDLPVTADLENGFGASPEAVADAICQAGAVGLAGGSIEDASYDDDDPLYGFDHAVERIKAAVAAARALPFEFMLTARTEGFVRGRPNLDETIRRLKAFEAAGADVLYAPGLPDLDSIRRVCSVLDKPVNVVTGVVPKHFSVEQLRQAGVCRISTGSSMTRAAYCAVLDAGREIMEQGTFTYAAGLTTVREWSAYFE